MNGELTLDHRYVFSLVHGFLVFVIISEGLLEFLFFIIIITVSYINTVNLSILQSEKSALDFCGNDKN